MIDIIYNAQYPDVPIFQQNRQSVQKQKNRINYEISNIPINHIHASSSGSPEFTKIIQSDIIHSVRYFPNQTESRV